jgi:hypothetical protein
MFNIKKASSFYINNKLLINLIIVDPEMKKTGGLADESLDICQRNLKKMVLW